MSNRRILPLPMGVLPNSYAVAINLDLDSEYVLSAQLVDQNGNAMGTAQTVDLPLESVIVNGRYDNNTQSLILVLDNGNEITIPVSGLVAGLQEEITAQNPLNADYITDGTTNKVFTATEQTKLSGIAAGAEVNVQADWNESDSSSDSYIQHKPTLGTMAAENASDYTPTSSLSSVATSGSYTDLSNTPDLSIYAQSANLATVATSGSYTDLSNTPDLSNYAQLDGNNTFTGDNIFTEATTFTSEYATDNIVNGQGFDVNFINTDDNGNTNSIGMYAGMPEITGETEYEEPELWVSKDTYEEDGDASTTTMEEVLVRPTEIILHTTTIEDDGQGGDPVETDTQHVVINQEGIEIDGSAVVTTDHLATVATSGEYDDLDNKPFTWYGTQEEFDLLTEKPAGDYYIYGKIDYETDVTNKPNFVTNPQLNAAVQTLNNKDFQQDVEISEKIGGLFLTKTQLDNLQDLYDGQIVFVQDESSTIQMDVTFTDQSTATYNLIVE